MQGKGQEESCQRNTHMQFFEAAERAAVIADDKKDMLACCDI